MLSFARLRDSRSQQKEKRQRQDKKMRGTKHRPTKGKRKKTVKVQRLQQSGGAFVGLGECACRSYRRCRWLSSVLHSIVAFHQMAQNGRAAAAVAVATAFWLLLWPSCWIFSPHRANFGSTEIDQKKRSKRDTTRRRRRRRRLVFYSLREQRDARDLLERIARRTRNKTRRNIQNGLKHKNPIEDGRPRLKWSVRSFQRDGHNECGTRKKKTERPASSAWNAKGVPRNDPSITLSASNNI